MNRFRFLGALLALTLIPSVSRAADPRPAGAEFILGACTTCREQAPAVAGAPSGALAAVWEGKTATDPRGLLVRFFNAQGKPQGAERLVSKNLAADQYDPAVAATPNGYVVAWSEVDQGKSDVLVQRFKSSGAALGRPSGSASRRRRPPCPAWTTAPPWPRRRTAASSWPGCATSLPPGNPPSWSAASTPPARRSPGRSRSARGW